MGSRALIVAVFALAAAAQVAPIPYPANLLREVVAAQSERDNAREAYTYRWHYRVDGEDAKGIAVRLEMRNTTPFSSMVTRSAVS